MAITYTWKLTSLKKRNTGDLENVIVQTFWQKIGTDEDGNEGIFSGATPFDPSQVDPDNFTSFENLTQTQVLGWIQSVVVGSYEQHVNEQIQKQIDVKRSPIEDVNESGFPWAEPQANNDPA